MALTEPPEHQAARQRTVDEDRALEQRALADHLAERRHAAGGVIEGPPNPGDDTIPVILVGCHMPPPNAEQRRATLDHLREQHAKQVAKAHGGQGVLPAVGES